MALRRVFEPISIGQVEIPNRVVRTAHDTGFAKPDVSDALIDYHVARARGGCGLTILEAARVHPSTGVDLRLYGPEVVPGLRRLMCAVRPYGMRVFQQLWHGGNLYPAEDGGPPWAVSDIPGYFGLVGQVMSRADIGELQQAFIDSAVSCREAGLDGVEVHAAHGYVFHQFLSPFYNTRTDEYGGSDENRSRFLVDTLRGIRAAAGRDFVVGVRLSASELAGGLTESDNRAILIRLQDERLIDYVDLSKGDYYRIATMAGAMQDPSGYQLSSTDEIGSAATVPRIVTGRFRTLEEVEQVLRAGQAELVSMVRAQIADPDLVRKTRAGRPEDVRPCISCNQGCIGGQARSARMGCTVNPAVGSESSLGEDLIERVARPQRVLVIGGGPAGMEAARVAALAGHHVVLAEARATLGGAISIARTAPALHGLGDIVQWLEAQVRKLGVTVREGTYMEADDVRAERADAIVVATGSVPRQGVFQPAVPGFHVPGCELPHVLSSEALLSDRRAARGTSALVLDTTGHFEALAAAEFLLHQGVAVSFLTHAPGIAAYVQSTGRDVPALERFYRLGRFEALTRHQLLEIQAGYCVVKPLQAGDSQRRVIEAQTVVLVTQNEPLRGLFDELRTDGIPVYLVGDAKSPRDLQIAIAEGHRAARDINSLWADRPAPRAMPVTAQKESRA